MISATNILLAALAGLLSCVPAQAALYRPCPDSTASDALKGTLCATVAVPTAYPAGNDSAQADPGVGNSISLFVRRFPAAGVSQGTVWVVAGGPGESGATLYALVEVLRRSFPDFDLMLPDHRGTGYSSRLCPQEEAADSPGGMALAGAEWASCFQHLNAHPELAAMYSITNAAHDLRWLITHDNSDKPMYVYAVSYGTQLVLRTLQLGKLPVKGIVLDSLVPLQTAPAWDLSQRSRVVDMVGRQVLAACDKEAPCHQLMGDQAETVYRRVLALTRQQPALLDALPGKNLQRFLGGMLDVPAARARIPYLINDMALGRSGELNGVLATLSQAQQSLGEFVQSPPSIPLVSIISASENNLRGQLSIDALRSEDEALLFTSRLPELLVRPALPLYPRDAYFGTLPERFPPLLTFSGTLDPKTPYPGALQHIAALRNGGQTGLVSVTGAPHFILWTAPDCFVRHTRAFVLGAPLSDADCALAAASP